MAIFVFTDELSSYLENNPQVAPEKVGVAELGSLSVEFTRLSQLTGDAKYYDAVQRISNLLEETQNSTKLPGMWPVIVDAKTPNFKSDSWFQLGGMSDSLYEYLPKQYLMLGGLLEQPKDLYIKFIVAAKKLLFFRPLNPDNLDILISGDIRINSDGPQLTTVGQHLGCFVGGMVGIASRIFERSDELEIAKKLTNGCVWAYDSQVTGVAPEIFGLADCQSKDQCTWSKEEWYEHIRSRSGFERNVGQTYEQVVESTIAERRIALGFTDIPDKRYILRPEAIESVFIMYRLTGDLEWQEKAWRMFEAIENLTKTNIASSAIADVTVSNPRKMDSMESFWLAETLKYFYLTFSDVELVSLDDYVFNTEAHPLKRPER
jgi:mannosyl-oligosaccharide alpha-1,2-mannosidase